MSLILTTERKQTHVTNSYNILTTSLEFWASIFLNNEK